MVEVTKVKINLSRNLQLGSEKFRKAFFTTPQSGLIFNDEGYNYFQKKYTFDFSKFTKVIGDKNCQEFKLAQPILAKLRELIVNVN
jgi:hypothetical protein